jgi:two-component system, sensor histidine kinase
MKQQAARDARPRTPTIITIGRVLLVAAGAVLLFNLVQLFGVLNERERTKIDAAREDTVWAAYQLEREAASLRDLLEEPVTDPDSWMKAVSQRYDILYSRTGVMTEGQMAARFGESQSLADAVGHVRNDILHLASSFDAIAAGRVPTDVEREALTQQLREISDLAGLLLIATNARHSEVKVAERAEVQGYYEQIAWNAGALGLVFVMLLILLVLQLRQIRRLNAGFQRAALEAEAGSRAKSAFLATMSHEIRTPLNGILGMADLLSDDSLNASQRQKIGVIRSAGDLLLDVINDILDFSKLESGGVELAITSFHIDELVNTVRDMMRPRATAKGLTLHISTPSVNVTTDPARLRQVLVNLVGNAIKFTEFGKVEVAVAIGEAAGGQPQLEITINDTGIGMSEATLGRLFQEFSQGDPSISRRFGGTGLGLAICKRLIEAMGGDITASSREGHGSTFMINVPCEVSAAVVSPASTELVTKPAGHRILVVEDNPINRQVAEGLLVKLGMKVSLAENGQQALEKLSTHAFDLVFMDMQMPVMDGLTATRIIRANGCVVPIVGLTANAFASDRAACLDAGMDDFVSKPVTRAKLAEAIDRQLWKKTTAARAEEEPAALVDSAQQQALIEEFGLDAYQELVQQFNVDAAELLAEADATTGTDAEVRALHSLKGMARTLGFSAIGDLAGTAELEARGGRSPDLTNLRAAIGQQVALPSAA